MRSAEVGAANTVESEKFVKLWHQLLPAIQLTPWNCAGNHMFDAEWRDMTHLGRNIIEVARDRDRE
jgi:hypothetical protein